MLLENKNILITGGSSGIGRAVAIACAKEGANIFVVGRNEERLVDTLKQAGASQENYIVYDFANLSDIASIFDATGCKLDGLVHCAGVPGVLPIRAMLPEQVSKIMDINFGAYLELVRCMAKKKYCEGGSIVGISSAVVERGEKCQTVYAASKAAMEAATKCLSFELVEKGIRINTVAPGMIRTEMMEAVIAGGSKEEELGKMSLMGIGEPEDVANAVIFLLSERSKHTTGRNVFVDGGCFL